MPYQCLNCERDLPSSADGERPQFCMFCGYRLSSADGEPAAADSPDHATRAIPFPPEDDADALPVMVEQAPSTIAGYRLLRFIGKGGMGNVYEAEAMVSGQKVAVKLLSRRLASNAISIERFRQEGRLASQISHPRCVFVLRADTDGGRPFIIMELMPGRTLKDVVDEQGPLSVNESIQRILDVIDGLIEAHRLGVIHRDVKPSNCFITDDNRVKIGDFGLSKSLSGEASAQANTKAKDLTSSGTFLVTVLFASPEQIRGEPVGYDSDVYAVCATLYYLLTGLAPHHHDSLTAALAKAISEPPPSVCGKRPDVPIELDKLLMRGLERDRVRRCQSLEELRDNLLELLPAQQKPARPRALVLAFVIDMMLLQFLLVPAEVLYRQAVRAGDLTLHFFDVNWLGLAVYAIYFTVLEGWTGATLGKRLVKLKVSRVGRTGPPGMARALLRTLVFMACWMFMFTVPHLLANTVGGWSAFSVGTFTFLAGLIVLSLQLKKGPIGFRGVHDLLAGTRTIQRPRPPARVRLVSPYPNPLDQTIAPHVPLPETIGAFLIHGKICETGQGGEVWIGEDKALSRRVIVFVEPLDTVDGDYGDHGVIRPARLRSVGHGLIHWGGGEREWCAFVAPAGSPLPDVVTAAHPLSWAETRPILDQLVLELAEAQADGSLPNVLTQEQLWIEPGGRLQLVDFPLPTGQAVAAGEIRSRYPARSTDPLNFTRQITTLLLEGVSRSTGGPIHAPIPPHASEITDRLFGGNPYEDLAQLRCDLAENHNQPAQVTGGMRAGVLTLQGLFVALGLIVMLAISGLYTFWNSVGAETMHIRGKQVQIMLANEQERNNILQQTRARFPATHPVHINLEFALYPDRLETSQSQMNEWIEEKRADSARLQSRLNSPERYLMRTVSEAIRQEQELDPVLVERILFRARNNRHKSFDEERSTLYFASAYIAIWPWLIWPLFAFLFRGGLGMMLMGVTLVTSDGRKAGRFRCAIRELLGWLPLWIVLQTTLWLQWSVSEMVFIRTLLWLTGVMMLPLAMAIALRSPNHGPHDRIMGTYVVPA